MLLVECTPLPTPIVMAKDGVGKYADLLKLKQMMFVAGETGEPSVETTTLIEQIVHEQVYEMVSSLLPSDSRTTELRSEQLKRSTATATRRGSRTITQYDLFFLIRHDKAKTSRLKTFLSWKDVRKTARDSDDKGADAADAADDGFGGGDVAGKLSYYSRPYEQKPHIRVKLKSL